MVKTASTVTIDKLKNNISASSPLPPELVQKFISERVKQLDSKYPQELLRVKELRDILHLGRDSVNKLLSSGKIKSETIGNKRVVTKLALAMYLVNLSI
jgi:hypothetical protein